MKNVLLMLKRDFKRLIAAPVAIIVLVGLLVLPSAYSWYNVAVFWDPYAASGNVSVSIVNEDAGAEIDQLGTLNVGNVIVDKLHGINKLKWVFEDRESAMSHLEAGESYAVFVIPSDFTSNLLSVATGEFTQPKISYYVNEKLGAISPKVTDMGQTVLDQAVNAAFVAVVTDVAVSVANGVTLPDGSGLQASVISRLDEIQNSLAEVRGSIAELDAKLAGVQANRDQAAAALENMSASLEKASSSLKQVSGSAKAAQESIQQMTPEMSQAVTDCIDVLSDLKPIAELMGYGEAYQQALDGLKECQRALFSQMLPNAATGLGSLSSSASSLSGVAGNSTAIMTEAKSLLAEIDTTLGTARSALSKTDALVAGISDDFSAVKTDLSSLSLSSTIAQLNKSGSVDAESVASFMASPTVVRTEKLYDMGKYGIGMAPMFMNLTFWIGAFMLMLVFKLVKDPQGVPGLTLRQHFAGRFLFFVIPVVLQAIVCCVGLLIMGLQPAEPVAFVAGAVVIALVYCSIIYGLSATLGHIGMGLSMVLVFIQIPAASGLYPVEMLGGFYTSICPLFPFTYGIAAMREALFGFYGANFFALMGILLLFAAFFLLGGLLIAPFVANAKQALFEQVGQSGLLNGGEGAPEEQVRDAELARQLSRGDAYQQQLADRLQHLESRYPRMVRTAVIIAVCLAIVVSAVCLLLGADRSIVLAFLLLCYIALLVFVVALESDRRRTRKLLGLGHLAGDAPAYDSSDAKGGAAHA